MKSLTNKGILILTPFFSPNIGGVETHLDDLVSELDDHDYKVYVQTYSPITTGKVLWKSKETIGKSIQVRRYKWFGSNLFHKLEKKPLINLLYITPYLFLRTFLWLIPNHRKIKILHSHGINAALIGIVLKPFFGINKHIVSIYSTYDNVGLNDFSTKLVAYVLNRADVVLTQSQSSIYQLVDMGVDKNKVFPYRHWIDLNHFKPLKKTDLRLKYKLEDKFTIVFIGRLIPQKGALLLAKSAIKLPDINFLIVGDGPDFPKIKKLSLKHKNIILTGNIPYKNLHLYYNLGDVFCIPSLYNEGWGRVIMEAVACGLPVIASNKGAIPEVVDNSVAIIIPPSVKTITQSILKLTQEKTFFVKLKNNCVDFARKRFSNDNLVYITKHY